MEIMMAPMTIDKTSFDALILDKEDVELDGDFVTGLCSCGL